MTVTAKVPQTPLGPLLQSFFVEHLCSHKRVSPRTVESYRDTFRLLLQHLQAKTGKKPSALSIGDLDAPVILSFLENLEQQRHNQAQSRNVRLTAIRSFFRLVTLRDPASISIATRVLAIPLKRTDQRLVGYLTRAEVDAILAANNLSEWSGRRDHVLLLTLYNTGARVSEIISLLQPQFSIGTKSFVQFNGKGRKERSVPLWPTTAKALKEWFSESGDRSPAVAFPNARGSSLTRDGVDYILQRAIERASVSCPSLNNKRVSPHILRHYLPFRTMSGNVMESFCGFGPKIPDRVVQSPSKSPDIVLYLLQTVQEGEESVAGFVATRRSIRRGCLGKCFLLHRKCRFEINLCGFNMFVTEPQCDHRTIDTCLQKIHGHGVPQAVHSDTLVFQRRAHVGSPHAMLVQQVLHAVDAETFTFCVGEQHASVTSLRLAQPGSQHGECGSSDGCTAFLASLTN